jgi:hypothetical protein
MTPTITMIFSLFVVFQIKHFVTDYPLQTQYMLGKFRPGWDFFLPLLVHSSVHGAATLLICLVVNPKLWWLALADIVSHFIMDRIKAGPKYLGRFKPLNGKEMLLLAKASQSDKVYWFDIERGQRLLLTKPYAVERINNNKWFWISLGLDQTWHHLSDCAIILTLVVL